jgi:microcystin-dependent protein
MRGRMLIKKGDAYILGQKGGSETETLNIHQMPSHNHLFLANSNPSTSTSPRKIFFFFFSIESKKNLEFNYPAQTFNDDRYIADVPDINCTISNNGSSFPVINFFSFLNNCLIFSFFI